MRRLRDDESGAMVVLVGVLMTLLLVLVALVVDTGRLYDEHRQLQNGADAAALAIAFDCARDDGTCAASAATRAEQYANANAVDDLSAIDPTSPLVSNPFIDFTERTVTVDTRSQAPGQAPEAGELGFVIEWPDGRASQPVRARAVAAWGTLVDASTIPLIISFCDFEAAVGPTPTYPSGDVTITFHDSSTTPDCDGHPGFDRYDDSDPLPAGFGALGTIDVCQVETVVADPDDGSDPQWWAYQDPGADFNRARDCLTVGQVATIPIFTDFCRGATCPPEVDPPQAAYRIGGYAAFQVSGWRFPGSKSNPAPCTGSTSCISGRFVENVVPPTTGALGSGPDFGVRTARLVK